ncbi:MAG: DUF2255 family protein [Bifidobacterium sp.]|uniref:DUF2255 family protein n=1 Tax=Bifidobacterium fermentum TaxID=3059035 RepID=A0AB39UBU2_9BIFI
MKDWRQQAIEKITTTDDFHIAPFHPDKKTTGTLTWIWSVVVEGRIFVRAWNGINGRWYQAAIAQHSGIITAAGKRYQVEFNPVHSAKLNNDIDSAYENKYRNSAYLKPMISDGPKSSTVEVILRANIPNAD